MDPISIQTLRALIRVATNRQGEEIAIHPLDITSMMGLTTADLMENGFNFTERVAESISGPMMAGGSIVPLGRVLGVTFKRDFTAPRLVAD